MATMVDLDALEAAVDAMDEGEVTYDTGGASLELFRRVQALKDAFLAGKLEGFHQSTHRLHTPSKRETTVLLGRGLRIVEGNYLYFHCVLDGCWLGTRSKSVIKCPNKITSNASTHLKTCHGVESSKTRAGKAKAVCTSHAVASSRPAFGNDPPSFVANAMTLWATEHSIPIAALQSTFLRHVLEGIPGCGNALMDRNRCRKLLLQQYLTIRDRIKGELKSAKLFFGDMPFICVNLDLYQDPRQNKKYMALRISWVDGVSAKLKSRLIGARHYNPTYREKNEQQASSLLAKWYKVVVGDFDITDDMVLGGSGDHGSDVKKVMEDHCGKHGCQEWCISHMVNVAFQEAFGTCNDKKESKNPDAMQVVARLRKMVESVSKSSYLRSLYEERQSDRTKKAPVKLTNPPTHRWGATESSMVGVLSYWEDLAYAHHEADRSDVWHGMEEIKQVLEEFHSVVRPFRHVQIVSQSASKFNLLTAIMRMNEAYGKLARSNGNTLTMLWPLEEFGKRRPKRKAGEPDPRERAGARLDPRTRRVIKMMREGLTRRYYRRFHPVSALKKPRKLSSLTEANVELSDFKASYLFEMALLFDPEMYKGAFIDKNCKCIDIYDEELLPATTPKSRGTLAPVEQLRTTHAGLVKAALWKKIRELALLAGRSLADRNRAVNVSQSTHSSPVSPVLPSQDTLIVSQLSVSPPRKKRRSLAATMGYASPLSTASPGGSPSQEGVLSVSEQVDREIQDYKTLGVTWTHGRETRSLADCNAIEWWCSWGSRDFPILAKVALAIFGILPGSGGLECDIGGFKDVIGPKRSRLDPAAVEMHLVVDKNKDLSELDPGKLVQLPKEWERMYPSRPASPVDYHVGEELERPGDCSPLDLSHEYDPNEERDPFR